MGTRGSPGTSGTARRAPRYDRPSLLRPWPARRLRGHLLPEGSEVDGTIAATERCDQTVDGQVGSFDGERYPPVETPAAEGRLDLGPAAAVVDTVGYDHRAVAHDEADDVELVPPPEPVGRHREQLTQ